MDLTSLNTLSVRLAQPKDLDAIMAIETTAWPSGNGMRAERFKFASRIECKFVTVVCDAQGEVLGIFSHFRPKWACRENIDKIVTSCPDRMFDLKPLERWQSLVREFGLPRDWNEATGNGTLWNGTEHTPGGQVVFGVGLAIRPDYKGGGIARFLLQSVLTDEAQRGARYFLGYSRLPAFHQFPHIDVDSYLRMTDVDEHGVRPFDPQLRFYWKAGARPMQSEAGRCRYVGIPGAMPDDPESHEHGLLIVAPMGATPFPLRRLS